MEPTSLSDNLVDYFENHKEKQTLGVTGSGYSASAGGHTTASVVHIFVSGAGATTIASNGGHDVAKVYQGGFAYIPINPNVSYYAYSPTGSGAAGLTGTIIEYGVFR